MNPADADFSEQFARLLWNTEFRAAAARRKAEQDPFWPYPTWEERQKYTRDFLTLALKELDDPGGYQRQVVEMVEEYWHREHIRRWWERQ